VANAMGMGNFRSSTAQKIAKPSLFHSQHTTHFFTNFSALFALEKKQKYRKNTKHMCKKVSVTWRKEVSGGKEF